jgi:hypothetical protein
MRKCFVLGEGRPRASVALRALIWLEEGSKAGNVRFIPTWKEMAKIMSQVLSVYAMAERLAEHCGIGSHQVFRHFKGTSGLKTEPEAETALAILRWLRLVHGGLPKCRRLPDSDDNRKLVGALKTVDFFLGRRRDVEQRRARRRRRRIKFYRF